MMMMTGMKIAEEKTPLKMKVWRVEISEQEGDRKSFEGMEEKLENITISGRIHNKLQCYNLRYFIQDYKSEPVPNFKQQDFNC